MKSLYKSLTAWFLCLVFVFSNFIVSFADVNSLMIGTSSNALMTLELDDSDYLMMTPRSSLGTVTNTIESDYIDIMFYLVGDDGSRINQWNRAYKVDGRYKIKTTPPDGYRIANMKFRLFRSDLPPAGNYYMSFDLASQFSHYYDDFEIHWDKDIDNASASSGMLELNNGFSQSSGDIYVNSLLLDISNVSEMRMYFHYPSSPAVVNIDFSFAINFTKTSESGGLSIGNVVSNEDYQSGVSDSLSDLSSSVDSMTEDLSSAAENLEYISTSQNLIIQGIDNVIMHISDQLYAFWDQLFNLIHLPTLAKMDDIISAINNMDLEIEVNLDGLKTTINNMSTAVQNKLQSTTDQITGGYDNSEIVSDQTELDTALNEYQQAEDELFDDAKDHLTNFEFDTPLDQFIKPIQDISYFMTGIFNGLAGLNIPIQFSLTLTIALILIGYYRIKR